MTTFAAFDLDGTLSRRDTVLPFLGGVVGRRTVAQALAREWRALWRMRAGGERRDEAKVAVLARLVAGRSHAELCAAGERFAAALLRGGLRDDVLARLRWHRAEGHDVALVTAALDVYVEPLGRLLGAGVLCTRLAVDGDGRCTGALEGPNCRGDEKVRRLDTLAAGRTTLWAYGNSADDAAMLAIADHPVWVGRDRLATIPTDPPPPGSEDRRIGGARGRPPPSRGSRRARRW